MTPKQQALLAWLSDFHSCALVAWMEVAAETGQWPPDSELTRRRAYELYEAEKKRLTPPAC